MARRSVGMFAAAAVGLSAAGAAAADDIVWGAVGRGLSLYQQHVQQPQHGTDDGPGQPPAKRAEALQPQIRWSTPQASPTQAPAPRRTVPPDSRQAEQQIDGDAIRSIQDKLKRLGYAIGSVDGVFGPRTRSAVAGWQEANGQPVSGYLNEAQRDRLVGETEAAYAEWQETRPAPATQQRQRAQYYRGADGCLRDRYGRRVGGQSLRCDLRGLFNQF